MTQQNDTERREADEAGLPPAPGGEAREAGLPAAPGGGQVAPAPSAGSPAAAAQDPAPVIYPSPYLDSGGVPQAYLAPPQPGQPRYGTPPAGRGGRPFAGGPPGSRQAERGQAGGWQAGGWQAGGWQAGRGQADRGQAGGWQAGRSPGPRPGPGPAARRDPALAPPWQRLVASIIDWSIVVVVSVIAFWAPLSQVWRQVEAVTTRYPDLASPAAQAAINSISRQSLSQHALLYWFLGIFGIALVYFWVQHAIWGATVGKQALGIRVVRAADRQRAGVLATGLRTLAFLVGPAAFLLLFSPVNVLGGVLWAVDAVMPLVDLRAQTLHDKIAKTVVIRRGAESERSRPPSPW